MGKVAGDIADFTILTAEDPRGETVLNINRQIAQGLQEAGREEKKDYLSIEDRTKAIKHAIKIAKPGDTIVITGKGHEKSMNLDGKEEIPWSDQMTVKNILNGEA
jgi:UDP-N-acetylmuramoyl-L-alanyl-D-glutamate--2,6-diaminopimelate ligase